MSRRTSYGSRGAMNGREEAREDDSGQWAYMRIQIFMGCDKTVLSSKSPREHAVVIRISLDLERRGQASAARVRCLT